MGINKLFPKILPLVKIPVTSDLPQLCLYACVASFTVCSLLEPFAVEVSFRFRVVLPIT